MKAPGFASTAPAPMTATAGDAATLVIWAVMLFVLAAFGGRRRTTATHTSSSTPATTSKTATQVFGVDECDAALSPRTKAAATPTASVAVSAPR